MVKTSIIIPTITKELVVPCVESIIENTNLNDKEVIIVANGADISLIDIIKNWQEQKLPIKCVWYDNPLGPVPALNIGLKNSSGEYIILLNDDVLIPSSPTDMWVNMLLDPFEKDPLIAMTGPCKIIPILGNNVLPLCEEDRLYGFIIFFCAAIPKRIIEEVGYFDEELKCAIDIDYCLKLKKLGYRICQVPNDFLTDGDHFTGDFPIYHKAEGTVHDFYGQDEWDKILKSDTEILKKRYCMKDVSIIIPAYGDCYENLKKCVDSILNNTTYLIKIELIIVANGCTDTVKQYLQNNNMYFRYLWYDDPLGFPKAVNTGILNSMGDIIVIINQDAVILGNTWLQTLIEPFKEDDHVGITGPLKLFCKDVERDNMLFFCVAIKKKVFDDIGLIDEQFYPGCYEDVDFCIRAEDHGWKMIQVPRNSELVKDKDFMRGDFPIYHIENHFNWISREDFEKNKQLLIKKHSVNREIFIPDWPMAQKKYEIIMFQEFLKNYKIDNVLEIGTYKGGFTYLLAHMANNIVYTIDIDNHTETFTSGDFHRNNIKDYFGKTYVGTPYQNKIVEFHGNSHSREFIDNIKSKVGKVDLIFIDGDHSYEGVKQDFLEYMSCLKPGGYIAFHDILDCKEHRDINAYVSILWNQLKKCYPYYEFVDNNEYSMGSNNSMGIGIIKVDNPDIKPLLSLEKIKEYPKVSAYISTKDRYDTTLPMAIMGIISQTYKVDEFILFDDSDNPRNLINDQVFSHLFGILERMKIKYRIIPGKRIGQVANHQKMLYESANDIIWRIDDDNYPMPNVLERLIDVMMIDEKIGAVGSSSLVWNRWEKELDAGKKIEELEKPNLQWTEFDGYRFVEHLHNTFLFKKEAASHGYPMNLSPVGHREETIFTHTMFINGWKLVVVGDVITWHLQQYEKGGIRVYTNEEYWLHDDKIFNEWMENKNKDVYVFILDSGIGDHLEFLKILPKIKDKYSDKKIILATCYPEVFEREGIEQISIGEAQERFGMEEWRKQNIYEYMDRINWKGPIKDAYSKMYGVDGI